MISSTLTCLLDNVGAFPVFLELPDSHFNCIFEDLSEDECFDLEGVGQCLTVVVGNRPLLIGSHLDGCTFPYFVRPVQVLSKFLAFVLLTLHGSPGHGHAYFHRDGCVHPIHKSERSVSCRLSRRRLIGP